MQPANRRGVRLIVAFLTLCCYSASETQLVHPKLPPNGMRRAMIGRHSRENVMRYLIAALLLYLAPVGWAEAMDAKDIIRKAMDHYRLARDRAACGDYGRRLAAAGFRDVTIERREVGGREIAKAAVEVLTPDFVDYRAGLDLVVRAAPDVFNHNIETVPRLYRAARPGADYRWSLDLIRKFGERHEKVPTKSGLMVGLGETILKIRDVIRDLRGSGCRMLTIGQYLAPSDSHLPVERYYTPEEFDQLRVYAASIGYESVASGPLVRSSYHGDRQSGLLLNDAH